MFILRRALSGARQTAPGVILAGLYCEGRNAADIVLAVADLDWKPYDFSMSTTDPMAPLVDAIAARLLERLKPLLEVSQGVRPRLLTVAQAAVYLGRTEKAVRFLAASGAFPIVRGDGRVQFDIRDLDRWIDQNKEG